MSSFVLKIIATISMLFDHTGYIIFNKFSYMNYIGRLAFPIFAFGIVEGYKHTKNLKMYLARLLLLGFISQIPFMLFSRTFSNTFILNIIFTFVLGLITIIVYEKLDNKYLGLFCVIVFSAMAYWCKFDYGWFGIAIIFIFHIFKDKKLLMSCFFIIATFINYIIHLYITTSRIEYIFIFLFCCLSLIPINLYNGKKGRSLKYFFYIFYPLHLIILYLLNFFV